MKKILVLALATIIAVFLLIYAFVYFVPYSEGVRSGELIKISRKGVLAKTWEGEISQGISGAQIFTFSVLDKNQEVINKLKEYQGEYVKLDYVERYATFFWLGDTKYFITNVEPEKSPHFRD
ncbi:6-phosphogluconate dehydrogenase [Maribacter sp. HTCC2170]|uniref:6-phosphogluconate dehydrogenase n=1 Tax=Maribacter sp. (strain HTCC2170 / KCCM 42371) TaxID=313603 RepID=UPI00006B470A|nr:6-phosphogluconate dehydrogenase [Maribacter sp. HTCC2170]EAR01609.1 6-phosphogluconate dehydrogenase [Maribacter sp. HTCC2170]